MQNIKFYLFVLIIISLSFSECSQKNKLPSLNILLNYPSQNQDKIEDIGKLSNLDILNGYRGLAIGMSFDSIQLHTDKSFNIDSFEDIIDTYSSKDIIAVGAHDKAYENILGKGYYTRLTFYKKKLEIIEFISNYMYSIEPLIIWKPRDTLITMFGKPNVADFLFLKGQSAGFKNITHDSIFCKWQTKQIELEYVATKSEDAHLTICDIKLKGIINKLRNEVDDSLSNIQNSLKKIKEKNLRKKFIKNF